MNTIISGKSEWTGVKHEAAQKLDSSELSKRVGRAWMMACRELKDSHTQIHQQLSRRVLDLLGDESIAPTLAEDLHVDSADALVMQKRFEAAQSAAAGHIDQLQSEMAMLEARLTDMYDMLEQHARLEKVSTDPHMAALQRINQLVAQAASPALAPSTTGSTNVTVESGDDDLPPNERFLQQVAQGEKSLNEAQRQWCIAEALILTAGGKSPEQLEAGGDQALAKLILNTQILEAA